MKANVCLVCLNPFDAADDLSSESSVTQEDEIARIPCGAPLFTRFLKFTENYLHLPSVVTQQLLLSGGGKEVFCEKCELSLITPICQVYLELLSAQLKLSSELEQLGKLLDSSKVSGSDKLRVLNINALSNQLGIRNLSQLEGFRTSLAQKCRFKRKKALPNVLITSRCGEDETRLIENEELSCFEKLEQDSVDPLALVEAIDDNNVLDLQPDNLSLPIPESGDGQVNKRIGIGTGAVIKLESFTIDSNPELIYENENDEESWNAPSELNELEAIPTAEHAGMRINGVFLYGRRCPACSKVLRDEVQYHIHYRYYHQPISCNECGKGFKGKKLLSMHFKRLHKQRGVYHCNLCSKVYDTAFKVSDHVTRFHRNEHVRYYCSHPNCDSSFGKKSALDHHMIAIHQPESHLCPHCPPGSRDYPTIKYLRRHIRHVHPQFFVSLERNPRLPTRPTHIYQG